SSGSTFEDCVLLDCTNEIFHLSLLDDEKSTMRHNAALSSEQRRPPNLNQCAVNTKFKANRKCQALEICLKRFVSLLT
ncbi:hypothetical protein ACFFUS_00010, partial [Vibrio gallaecicus]|uniref:hypothetical protein n=1 Tax=Vibrio gallaecicus TaxID=552386 RepID=UPI0035EA5C35